VELNYKKGGEEWCLIMQLACRNARIKAPFGDVVSHIFVYDF